MGGSKTEVYNPTPAPAPTAGQSVKEWADALPQIYRTQLQYEPLLQEQQLGLQTQYAPELLRSQYDLQAEYMPQMAALEQSISQDLYPQTAGLQEQLAGQASAGMQAGTPDWAREQYLSDMNAQLGANVGSGIGADYVSRGLLQQQEDWKRYYQSMGLSAAGRQPLTQPQAVNTPTVGTQTNYMQGMQPGNVMNYNAANYASQTQAARPMTMAGGRNGVQLGILGNWGY